MGAESTAPVERGQTYYGPTQTIDTANYAGISLEGQRAVFLDTDYTDSTKLRSGREVKARLMRNVSGSTLYAGYAVSMEDGYEKERFGNTFTKGCKCAGIIDDRLGSGGCRNGDLCWIIVAGPCRYHTPSATPATQIGDLLYAKTADGGRLTPWQEDLVFSATDVTDGDMGRTLANALGRAIEASTSGETDTVKLMDVGLGLV